VCVCVCVCLCVCVFVFMFVWYVRVFVCQSKGEMERGRVGGIREEERETDEKRQTLITASPRPGCCRVICSR